MDWVSVSCLLMGVGLGFGSGWLLRRSRSNPLPLATSPGDDSSNVQALQNEMQQLKLAYQMATEMLQFKSGFLARTSHELRSPLSGLIGMHQLILSDLCDSPEEEREFVAQADVSALKLVSILDNILEVAKAEYGISRLDIQPLQLAHLLQNVYTLTHLQAKNRNLQLRLLPASPDLYVLADPARLQQVLVYLVDSAILQMEEGEIVLSGHPVPDSGCVHIWVDDQCPADSRSELIDRLQSQPDPTAIVPSPGLNLLVAQTLLELMQGQLEVVAADPSGTSPKGTRLQCSLPIVELEPTLE